MSLPLSIAELCFDSHIDEQTNAINNNSAGNNNRMMLMNTVGEASTRINEICERLLNDVRADVDANRKSGTTPTTNESTTLLTMSRRIASAVRLNAFRLASCAMSIRIDDNDNGNDEENTVGGVRRRTLTTTTQRRWPPAESQIDADPIDAVKYSGLFTLACFFNHRL